MRAHLIVAIFSVLAASCSCSEGPVDTGRSATDAGRTTPDAGGERDSAPSETDGARCVVRRDVVVNGTFSEGNTGFTTDLMYAPDSIYPEGTYTVEDDPRSVHPSFPSRAEGWLDHTDGDDNLVLAVNGSVDVTQSIVWRQSVPAIRGVTYSFRAYVRAMYPCPCGSIYARVLTSDGASSELASGVAATQLESWTEVTAAWTATETGMVDLTIGNTETASGGNDFAVDDIAFIAEDVPEGCELI
jgi:hypothetical protein